MSGAPDLSEPLRDRDTGEIHRLVKTLRRREHVTRLEQVLHEVGPKIFAAMAPLAAERPCLIRRGMVVGLPPGTYELVLREVLERHAILAS